MSETDDFWKNEGGRSHMDICDVSAEDFRKMHKNVLAVDMDTTLKGMFIMGRYYLDGFHSRSCCAKMAECMGEGDYLDYYCGSSEYWLLMHILPVILPLMEASNKDESSDEFKQLWRGKVDDSN